MTAVILIASMGLGYAIGKYQNPSEENLLPLLFILNLPLAATYFFASLKKIKRELGNKSSARKLLFANMAILSIFFAFWVTEFSPEGNVDIAIGSAVMLFFQGAVSEIFLNYFRIKE